MRTTLEVLSFLSVVVATKVHKGIALLLAVVGSLGGELNLVLSEGLDNLVCNDFFISQRSFSLGDVSDHLQAYLGNTQHNVTRRKYLTEVDLSFGAEF